MHYGLFTFGRSEVYDFQVQIKREQAEKQAFATIISVHQEGSVLCSAKLLVPFQYKYAAVVILKKKEVNKRTKHHMCARVKLGAL